VVLVVLLELDRRLSQAGSDQTQRLVLEPTQETVQPVVPLLVLLVALPRVLGKGRERKQRRKKKSARPRKLRRSGRRIWRRELRRRAREKLGSEKHERHLRKNEKKMPKRERLERRQVEMEEAHTHIPPWAKRPILGREARQLDHPPRSLLLLQQRPTTEPKKRHTHSDLTIPHRRSQHT
jgi:hypothetical protein